MEYWAISNPLLRYSITPLLPSAIVQLTPFHCPIRRFDIVRETVFTFPIFRSRYAQLFFDFVQRFTLLRHLLHPSHERIIVAFHVVEDFNRARIPCPGITISGLSAFIILMAARVSGILTK